MTNGETVRNEESKKPRQINLLQTVERPECESSREMEIEQRINMKFYYKLETKGEETHAMLIHVFGTDTESRKRTRDSLNFSGLTQRTSHVPVDPNDSQH
ncbi:hypothetical protein NPIL_697081 [Nephila pilipes]|uniref:Uncharacterized protein n=1 Tax=Nephila pilipes TaxID=299642 RepID=A0A8X6UHF8_NEPPI|nr:hypothetical protein NPIL_697081 [Nephila pilipes]